MLGIFLYAGRAIMPLLLMMALGCGLRRAGRWSDDFYRQLNGFCFHVLLPVQLFLNVYAIEDLSVLNWRLLGFIVVCILGAAGLGVAAAPLFARDRGQRAVIAQATFRANQVIMGIPLASALGGEEALIFASLVTSVCVPVFNVLAVVVLTAYSEEKNLSWRDEVRRIFQNPLIPPWMRWGQRRACPRCWPFGFPDGFPQVSGMEKGTRGFATSGPCSVYQQVSYAERNLPLTR